MPQGGDCLTAGVEFLTTRCRSGPGFRKAQNKDLGGCWILQSTAQHGLHAPSPTLTRHCGVELDKSRTRKVGGREGMGGGTPTDSPKDKAHQDVEPDERAEREFGQGRQLVVVKGQALEHPQAVEGARSHQLQRIVVEVEVPLQRDRDGRARANAQADSTDSTMKSHQADGSEVRYARHQCRNHRDSAELVYAHAVQERGSGPLGERAACPHGPAQERSAAIKAATLNKGSLGFHLSGDNSLDRYINWIARQLGGAPPRPRMGACKERGKSLLLLYKTADYVIYLRETNSEKTAVGSVLIRFRLSQRCDIVRRLVVSAGTASIPSALQSTMTDPDPAGRSTRVAQADDPEKVWAIFNFSPSQSRKQEQLCSLPSSRCPSGVGAMHARARHWRGGLLFVRRATQHWG